MIHHELLLCVIVLIGKFPVTLFWPISHLLFIPECLGVAEIGNLIVWYNFHLSIS